MNQESMGFCIGFIYLEACEFPNSHHALETHNTYVYRHWIHLLPFYSVLQTSIKGITTDISFISVFPERIQISNILVNIVEIVSNFDKNIDTWLYNYWYVILLIRKKLTRIDICRICHCLYNFKIPTFYCFIEIRDEILTLIAMWYELYWVKKPLIIFTLDKRSIVSFESI